jgi:UDP-N-acetylmuramate--alanine ligase
VSASTRPWAGRRLHFIGVGGAGMSAYARAAHSLGAQITGSDRASSTYTQSLLVDNVLEAAIGHQPQNVPDGEDVQVVYSSAVPEDNPERVRARERGLRELARAELLGELSALRRTIAVAGTHGKTTSASMLVHALRGAGLDPGWLIGGSIGGGLPNGHWSEGEWLVIEADESDRSMLALDVQIAVLTNIELDHHSTFSTLEELTETFQQFLEGADQAVVWDRPELVKLRADAIAYNLPAPELADGGSKFPWRGETVRLRVPGAHNALNACGALEAAALAGADTAKAITALGQFTGAGRRFQPVGKSSGGGALYDDYAHHPTEVAATLQGARTLPHRRLVAVFQPHLFSRTALLAREFGAALALADIAVVLEVYGARERAEDFPGVSGLLVAEATAGHSGGRPVYWLAGFDDAQHVLAGLLSDGDLCVVMGAGDVNQLAARLTDG